MNNIELIVRQMALNIVLVDLGLSQKTTESEAIASLQQVSGSFTILGMGRVISPGDPKCLTACQHPFALIDFTLIPKGNISLPPRLLNDLVSQAIASMPRPDLMTICSQRVILPLRKVTDRKDRLAHARHLIAFKIVFAAVSQPIA